MPAGQLDGPVGVHAGRDRHHPRRGLQAEEGARHIERRDERLTFSCPSRLSGGVLSDIPGQLVRVSAGCVYRAVPAARRRRLGALARFL